MDNAPAVIIMLCTIPAVIGSVVAAFSAKNVNTQARARRAQKARAAGGAE